jgi:hypothetical protein
MRVLLVIALAVGSMACAAREPAGPAWPRTAAREADGGESLAPRAAARAIAAVVDDRAADRAGDKPAAASLPAASAPAAAAPGSVQVTEEPLPLDELVIEIDD